MKTRWRSLNSEAAAKQSATGMPPINGITLSDGIVKENAR